MTKENFTIVGPGVSENPNRYVQIPEPHGFNVGGARQPPGCVNSQHSHLTAEVFVVHTGRWRFRYGVDGDALEHEYGIPKLYLTGIMSPWGVKRLEENEGDITRFSVVRVQPSVMRQAAIAKTEPGDENNQDISSLVGKVDIRRLESYAQDDRDA